MTSLNRVCRRHRFGALLAVASLAACGGSTEPANPMNVAGVFVGSVSWAAASCTPSFPEGIERNAFVERRILDLSQSGASLNGTDHLAPWATITGSVTGDAIVLKDSFEWNDLTGIGKLETNFGLRLDASGRLSGTGQFSGDVTQGAAQTRTICNRTATLDARRTGPIVDLTPASCANEANLRPQTNAAPAFLIWRNEGDREFRVHRRDANGTRVFEGELSARGLGSTETFENYPYVLTDLSDNCIGVYLPRASGPGRITVR